MQSQVSRQADARMARDAWSMSVDRQRAAEAAMDADMSMASCRAAADARKAQERAWRAMDRAEARAA